MLGFPLRFIRGVLAGVVGFLVGGASGFATSYIFIVTPLQQVLGMQYSEFDFFGVTGVTVFTALIACVAATYAGVGALTKLRSTFQTRNLLALVLAPMLVAIVLTFAVSGEWAWLGLIHLSACSGILAGAGSALLIGRDSNTKPNHCVNRSSRSRSGCA